ncbi:MAG TPA: WD40 repeat domain-containing protein [Bryobacteraceae bacterium]|nr:WD40 repeat domain-containing protein [Bryobacteraceae bacterium]
MKRSITAVLSAMLFASVIGWIPAAVAATEAEKRNAIQKGLAYLYATQQSGGYWNFSGYEQAATGAGVSSFLRHHDSWGSNAFIYKTAVETGIAYLISTANTTEVSTRNDGVNICPGRAGSCTGVYWFGNSRSTFTTGLVAPAIAAYGLTVGPDTVATVSGPLAGMTWGQIAQSITNTLAATQSTNVNRNRTGGWPSLIPGNGDATSADTQWAAISLIYNETLGAITPEATKDALTVWLNNIQSATGAVCSQPDTNPCAQADTGGWLLAMKFVGYDLTNSKLQAALSFLNTEWQSPSVEQGGAFGQPLAMWSVYNGLAATIGLNDTTRIGGCHSTAKKGFAKQSSEVPCTWWEDYNQWLVDNQRVDGGWGQSASSDPLAVAFSIDILGATQIPLRANPLPGSIPSQHIVATMPQIKSAASMLSTGQPSAGTTSITHAQGQFAKIRKRVRRGVTAIALSEDGSALASAGTDKRIIIWSPVTGTQQLTLPRSLGIPTSLAFSRAGLISAGKDSLVRLWDKTSGRELAQLAGHENAVNAITTSPNGSWLATAGEGTRIMVWHQNSRKLAKVLFGSKDFVNTLSFSPDSQLLASAGEDTRVLIFDVATGKLLFTLLGHSGSIDAVAFSPNGTVLASAGQDTEIHLWDPVKGQQRQVLRGHSAPIRTLAFSPDGRLIASAGEDTQIRLWNAATGALNKVLAGSTGAINTFAFDPKGLFLASASESGEITLWNLVSGAKLITIRVPGAL